MLNRKVHTSLISHHVKNWYQYATFGKCDLYYVRRRSISIIFGGKICAKISHLYVIPVKNRFFSDVKNRYQIHTGVPCLWCAVPMVGKLQQISQIIAKTLESKVNISYV